MSIKSIIRTAGFSPIESMCGRPDLRAAVQRAMAGLTHFYDADTLRFFGCSVSKATTFTDGLFMGTVCRQKRGFDDALGKGYVIAFHDFTGHHIGPEGDRVYYNTKRQAEKAFYAFSDGLSARDILHAALSRELGSVAREAQELNAALSLLGSDATIEPEYAVVP